MLALSRGDCVPLPPLAVPLPPRLKLPLALVLARRVMEAVPVAPKEGLPDAHMDTVAVALEMVVLEGRRAVAVERRLPVAVALGLPPPASPGEPLAQLVAVAEKGALVEALPVGAVLGGPLMPTLDSAAGAACSSSSSSRGSQPPPPPAP